MFRSSQISACVFTLAVLVLAPACFSGSVGAKCDGEYGCPQGWRCSDQTGETNTCTASCDSADCPSGTCIQVEDGAFCARSCTHHGACAEGLRCRRTDENSAACWEEDPNLETLPTGLRISETSVEWEEQGGTWRATLNVTFKNFGPEALDEPTVDLVVPDDEAGRFSQCDSSCREGGSRATCKDCLVTSGTLDSGDTTQEPLYASFEASESPADTLRISVERGQGNDLVIAIDPPGEAEAQ